MWWNLLNLLGISGPSPSCSYLSRCLQGAKQQTCPARSNKECLAKLEGEANIESGVWSVILETLKACTGWLFVCARCWHLDAYNCLQIITLTIINQIINYYMMCRSLISECIQSFDICRIVGKEKTLPRPPVLEVSISTTWLSLISVRKRHWRDLHMSYAPNTTSHSNEMHQ